MQKRTEYRPQPGPQEEFLQRDEFEGLYGGSKGGGKTYALLLEATRYTFHSEYKGIIFRRTYPVLDDIVSRSRPLYGSMGSVYNEAKHIWTFPNGSTVRFRHCQYEKDKYLYQGHEYHFMGFDQLEEFTETQYTFLKMQCRSSVSGLTPYVRATANPGGIGHAWVRKRFMLNDFGEPIEPRTVIRDTFEVPFEMKDLIPEKSIERTRIFIPSRVYDNKILLQNDPQYLVTLMSLPEKERKALLEGDWSVFEGQYFTQWSDKMHTCRSFEIPAHWLKFRCMDYGSTAPFACLWGAVNEEGQVFIYREYYADGYTARESANKIMDMSPEHERYIFDVIDPSVFSSDGRDTTIIDEMRQEAKKRADDGCKNPLRLEPASNERIGGWNVVKENLLYTQDSPPKLQVFTSCPNLIRTLPALVHDPVRVEDVDSDGEDHAPDGLRYGLVRLKGKASKAPEGEEKKKTSFGRPVIHKRSRAVAPWDML